MGNEQSSKDTVTISKQMMEDYFNTKKRLESEVSEHLARVKEQTEKVIKLRNENQVYSDSNRNLQSELNSLNEIVSESKRQAIELYALQKQHDEMKKEMERYQSIPALKEMLDLHSNLKKFHEKLSAAMKLDVVSKESKKFETKLEEVKAQIASLESELKEKKLKARPKFFNDELKQAMVEMKLLKKFRVQKEQDQEGKLSEMLSKLKSSVSKLDHSIPEVMDDVKEQVVCFEKELAEVEASRPQFTDQEKTAIKKVLALQINRRQQFTDFLSLPSNDSDSQEYNAEGNNKLFHIILQNVIEEYEDFVNDKDKVLHILQQFRNIAAEEFRVRRLGASSLGNTRPIMVTFTAHRYISILLSQKHLMHQTKYGDIKIRPFIKDRKGKEFSNNKNTGVS